MPQKAERPAEEVPAERGDPTDRMLAAVVAGQDRIWFLKAVGPKNQLDPIEEPLKKLFTSFEVGGEKPVWETPGGWMEEQGAGMRLVTFKSPEDESGDSVEVSVIGLPRTGDWEPQLLGNVNRWRGQMGQPRLAASDLQKSVAPLGEDREQSVLVDITGWFSGGMAPTGARPSPAIGAPQAREPGDSLVHDTPEGWTDQPGSAMRKASFRTAAGSEVTAFVFAAGGGMSDPLGNVNRWRGQVGLQAATQEELDNSAETMAIAGGDATYVELIGENDATLAAMSQRGPRIWFFKLTGPVAAVESDREAFRSWLESLKF